ncbi:CPBP family intramembrane glutamic endopeptidase [Shewanella mangrovisoli]|uniref:CPBP family intramembrane glutamic endopeptidase n=1 Tax=Shewanella mangrovisoli TaxID=2864211 RepID=UPI001C65E010|nr:type II CAAX endopeptidase family protein [Shewanella mangrovisoli]QYK08560.1 CPBP family intramembrane metalloprotease [Shewanella mangrovisoli]
MILTSVQEQSMKAMNDFPFYNGKPISLTAGQWALLVLGTILGFITLVIPYPFGQYPGRDWVNAFLFPGIPLCMFYFIVGKHWRLIFDKLDLKAVRWMFLIAILNIVITVVIGKIVVDTVGATANPAFELLRHQEIWEKLQFFLRTIPQLFGEELITVFPFLALMWLLHTHFGVQRKTAIIIAWIGSAILFGMAHLPTYQWNWVQCLIVIGTARIVLLLAYLKTKNILVSTGAHIINDWALFSVALLLK